MRRIAIAALLTASVAAEAPAQPLQAQPIQIREIGSLHVGGRVAEVSGLPEQEITFSPGAPPLRINPNGQFQVEQMYAQYVRLADPRARYPLILAHGGGLTVNTGRRSLASATMRRRRMAGPAGRWPSSAPGMMCS